MQTFNFDKILTLTNLVISNRKALGSVKVRPKGGNNLPVAYLPIYMSVKKVKNYKFFVGFDVSKHKLDCAFLDGNNLVYHKVIANDTS